MATISLNPTLYSRAQDYAKADGMSVEEWVAMLITRFKPAKKKTYKMKQIEELSPELQALIGFAKPDVSTVAEKKTRRKKYKAEDFAGIWDDENYMAAEDINKAIRDTRHVKSSRDEIWDKL